MNTATTVAADVAEAITWLDRAAALLNPEHVTNKYVTVRELVCLWSCLPPPPLLMQTAWSELVWPQAGEPVAVYVLRCLACHKAITGLLPFCMPELSSDDASVHSQLDDARRALAHLCAVSEGERGGAKVAGLQCGLWRVVGLRVAPYARDLIQAGWRTGACARCLAQPNCGTTPSREITLPRLYGGQACPRCGRAYPRTARLTRRCFLVVEDEQRVRCAALLCGDGALLATNALAPAALSAIIGQTLCVHYYEASTEAGQPLKVIHAATPVPKLSFAATVLAHALRANCFLADHQQRRGWAARRMTFAELACCVRPSIVGQDTAKMLLLLTMIHTLYRAGGASLHWAPLHVLFVGPSRSGRSSLLSAASDGYGAVLASRTNRTHISQRRAQTGSSTPLEAAWPWCVDGVLMSGDALSASALLIDDIEDMCSGGSCADATAGLPAALTLLVTQQVCGVSTQRAAAGGGSSGEELGLDTAVLPCTVQITATAHEENRHIGALAQLFPLVLHMSPQLSLSDTAIIGHNVVASSLARSSQSRSASRATSASLPPSGGVAGSPLTSAESQQLVGALDDQLLLHIIASAPPEARLMALLPPWEDIQAHFTGLLREHVLCVEDTTPRPTPHLPLPASLRGCAPGADRAPHACQCSVAALMDMNGALRALCALFLARVICETLRVAAHEISLDLRGLADEVWVLYQSHLRARANLLGTRDTPALPRLAGNTARSSLSSPTTEAATTVFSARAGGVQCGLKRPRSQKASRLLLHTSLLDAQEQQPDGVVPHGQAVAVFESLGGVVAMGASADAVLEQLQHEGWLIRRPGGWKAVQSAY